jgi:flagellar hook-basal body complex protein FliE
MSAISPEISQVLAQMRVMSAQVGAGAIQPPAETQSAVSFSDILTNSINSVNEAQQTSSTLKTAFEMGDPNVSITEVMIASEKSSLAFSAMVEVRNKMLDAYKEIMNLPV